jgi:phenylacetate-coenzyme A ligase PaaK-like adenylate-forming protein
VLAGRLLHRSLRSQELRACALWPARHAGVHAPGTHLAADDPPGQSGDLALWTNDKTECGRTYPRLPQGIFGRIDDMVTIRGENVYPSEIDAVLNKMAHYGGEHRIVVSREGIMDELLVRVECDAELHAKGDDARSSAFRDQVAHDVRTMLGLRTMVEVVGPGHLPAHRLQGAPCRRRPRGLQGHAASGA